MQRIWGPLVILLLALCFAVFATALAGAPRAELRPWLGSQEWNRDAGGLA